MLREEKRKKGRTGIEPAAKAEPLPALSAVLHKSKCGDHPRLRAKSPLGVRRPTPKLPPSTHSSTLGWMREGLLPEFDQVLCPPPPPPSRGSRSCGPQRWRGQRSKMRRETVQYVRFPGGPPPEYWTRPWLLSFGDRTGSGVSNQV